MSDEQLNRLFARARLDDRQLNELIGLAHGIIADGRVNHEEAKYLHKWLAAHLEVRKNPVTQNLLDRVERMLADDNPAVEELKELFDVLAKFAGGDFELGEVLKSSSLPLDTPAPTIIFSGNRFCFTGTFGHGSRPECERVTECRGATTGLLTNSTNYLVIGIYATGSWKNSPFGLKITKALEMKRRGLPIAIVGELAWKEALDRFPPQTSLLGQAVH